MKRLFLASFDWLRKKDPNVSLAASSILAQLKRDPEVTAGYDIVHRQYNVNRGNLQTICNDFLTDTRQLRPDFVATGVYVWNESYISPSLNELKAESPYVVTVLGGPQVTYNPAGSLEVLYPYGDIFIRGYAEQSLTTLLKNLRSKGQMQIDGVHYKGHSDLGVKSVYDLSALPSPLLSPGIVKHKQYLRLETKRGCPFTCSFWLA